MGHLPSIAADKQAFTERFATYWVRNGGSDFEGRICGYLLLDDSGGVSAAQLADDLAISRGSISMAVRRLEQAGFIRRTRRPGSRADWFVMDADVWGGFLDHEHNYLVSQRNLAADALNFLPADSPARDRVRNMHDYMSWLVDLDLRTAWQEQKQRRDS